MNLFFEIVFVFFSLYLIFRSISYSIYEYKNEENKYGSICFLILVIFVVVLSNVMVFVNV